MKSAVPASKELSAFAAALTYCDLLDEALLRLKQCLIDAIACASYGRQFSWSRHVLKVAIASGRDGRCRFPGAPSNGLAPGPAALVLGTFCHAFEQDSLRRPGAGVHAGATVALPAFAVAQHAGANGKALLAAIAAGVEVMFRIGAATLHTPEKRGFHAPGLTGPFGAAIACAKLLGASEDEMVRAMGIAGSTASGLLAFARAKNGGMVKRFHLGRAAEGGVLAALLAMEGFEGPDSVLDGAFGLLDAFCLDSNPSLLTANLGSTWQAETICLKKYPCHITAHAPLEAMALLRREADFKPEEIQCIKISGTEKMVSHHNIPAPANIMLAQYSIPFCLALSLFHDAADPQSFNELVLSDPNVAAMAANISVQARVDQSEAAKGWGVDLIVRLRDGRVLETTVEDFSGTPQMPFTQAELAAKFRLLSTSSQDSDALFETLIDLENVDDVADITWA